jgi:hypothetical protein
MMSWLKEAPMRPNSPQTKSGSALSSKSMPNRPALPNNQEDKFMVHAKKPLGKLYQFPDPIPDQFKQQQESLNQLNERCKILRLSIDEAISNPKDKDDEAYKHWENLEEEYSTVLEQRETIFWEFVGAPKFEILDNSQTLEQERVLDELD